MITFAQIVIGDGGGVACTRCGGGGTHSARPTAAIAADIVSVAGAWTSGPGPNVEFVGYEPFAHPELPVLVEAARSAGCERVRLRTDGGALAVGGNAAGALRAGVRHIELVLLAGDADTHDTLAARSGLHAAALAGAAAFLEVALETGVPVALTGLVPVCRHNAAAVVGAVVALGRAGAVAARIEPVDEFELASAVAAEALTAATVAGVALHGPAVAPFAAEPWYSVAGPARGPA